MSTGYNSGCQVSGIGMKDRRTERRIRNLHLAPKQA
jgi:hypothetical protein